MSMKSYFKGVVYEAKKVEWPTGKKLNTMVLSVVQVCAIFAIIFLIMDIVISTVFKMIGV